MRWSPALLAFAALAQTSPAPKTSGTAYSNLKLRSIGPAMISGRIVDLAVDPGNAAHYYVAAASGGIWKTANNGTTWTPVFDNEGSYSIGALALDPHNFSILWAGTGEANAQRSVSYGDGVYRTEDGGKTWRNLGLKTSEHIGRIAIDPRDPKTVYVAAQGPLWKEGGDRGLFKTTDAGRTWQKVLSISANTGVTDVAIDPRNPDTLIAASYQRRRHTWTLIDGGPESAIYRSTDAGATWSKITAGLPAEDLGRITFAPSGKDPALVYASIEAANHKSGIYRSLDFGASWELRAPQEFAGMYFGRIYADPHTAARVYFMNVRMTVSDDGAKTFRPLGERYKHSDNHVIYVDPRDPDHYLVGCDGGIYETYDRALNWQFKNNLPLGQFYDVAADNRVPFYSVYGGTQDNSSVGGPARTRNISGITNADWFVTQGGDGFHTRVDPDDPDTVYAELQYGVLTRYDRRTGERQGIQPQPGPEEEPYRWNWDSPLLISPHSHTRLYFAAQKLFRSDDRGSSWRAVSPDLTQRIDRNRLPVMGRVWGPDAVAKNTSTAFYSNISSLSESPKKEGLLYAGTDDGWIQVSEDGGAHWRKSNDFPNVPERSYVSRVVASQHSENTVYAALENHQSGDFTPYLLRSTDAGRSWTSLRGDLPANGAVYAFAEDPKSPNLLFAGTEYGLYFSANGGQNWTRLKGGLPTIAVRDLAIQKQQDDLIIGTFGRGIYILDDYSVLRTPLQETTLFPVRDVPLYVPATPYGGGRKANQGEAFYSADNPPAGALFTYYLQTGLLTRAERRRAAEKQGGVLAYPDAAVLRAEAAEEPPAMILTVTGPNAKPVRRLIAPAAAGFHRVEWDLREPAPLLGRPPRAEPDEDEVFNPQPSGPVVAPGVYQVALARRIDGVITAVSNPVAFRVTGSTAEPVFSQSVAKLERQLAAAVEAANATKQSLSNLKRALYETPGAPAALINQASGLEKRTDDILLALRGDLVLRAHDELTPPSLSERLQTIQATQRQTMAPPTATQRRDYEISEAAVVTLQEKQKALSAEVKNLEAQLDRLGAPYTPRN